MLGLLLLSLSTVNCCLSGTFHIFIQFHKITNYMPRTIVQSSQYWEEGGPYSRWQSWCRPPIWPLSKCSNRHTDLSALLHRQHNDMALLNSKKWLLSPLRLVSWMDISNHVKSMLINRISNPILETGIAVVGNGDSAMHIPLSNSSTRIHILTAFMHDVWIFFEELLIDEISPQNHIEYGPLSLDVAIVAESI